MFYIKDGGQLLPDSEPVMIPCPIILQGGVRIRHVEVAAGTLASSHSHSMSR